MNSKSIYFYLPESHPVRFCALNSLSFPRRGMTEAEAWFELIINLGDKTISSNNRSWIVSQTEKGTSYFSNTESDLSSDWYNFWYYNGDSLLGNAGVGLICSDGANWKSEPQNSTLITLVQDRLIKIMVIKSQTMTDHLFSPIGKSLSCRERLRQTKSLIEVYC